MKQLKTKEGKLMLIILSVFIVSLLPIIAIAFSSVPAYDDFNHSIDVYKVVQSGGGLLEIIAVALERVRVMYMTWQGTYVAIFLSALQPGVFGQQFYWITPIFIIGTLVVSNFYLCKWLFGKVFQTANKTSWVIIATVISFFQVQLLPSAQEGFFWWSGGIMHTFTYSIYVIQIAYFLKTIRSNKISALNWIVFLLLSFIVGGGAHEIALAAFTTVAGILFLRVLYTRKNKIKIERKEMAFSCFALFSVVLFLLLNIAAPGNAVRAAEFGVKVPAVVAILESFVYSTVHLFEYTSLATLLVALLVFTFTFPAIKNYKGKAINPLWVFVISFCIYSSIFTPAIYGENYVASPRYLNVLYFSFYWFMITNLLATVLYYRENKNLNQFYNLIHSVTQQKVSVLAITFLFFMTSSILQFSYVDATSSSALIDILLGNAKSFKAVNDERFSLLLDETKKEIELPNYDKVVRVFFYDEFDEEPHQGKNSIYETYFEKDSIVASKQVK